jgi:prepilin-type N-terminal cleavage/methylation domain-containing protein
MNIHHPRRSGFTLIELLVVIAIIGILSAVVLASLSTARQKGNDAAVQSNLSTIQTEAEIYYGGVGANSYGTSGGSGACTGGMFTDTTIVNALASAKNSARGGVVACNAAPTVYAVQAGVTGTTTGEFWCVDSTGVAKYDLTALGSATACP